jgi:hypothetical protein
MRTLITTLLVAVGSSAWAQRPRPPESPRSVTLSLAEYNRLLDLASRPPAPTTVAPVGAVVASAELKVYVEGASARGVFSLG